VHAFRVILDTFVRLLPASSKLLKAFTIMLFCFAQFGMQVFGGIITSDRSGAVITSEQADALEASDFGQSGYGPNSFNDLPSGMITLFELLVVNNWQVITSGYVAVLGVNARWFFIAFYGVGVDVLLNIVIAFVLDSYEAHAVEIEKDKDMTLKGGATLMTDRLEFNASRIAPGVRGTFEVKMRALPYHTSDSWREVLVQLFSPHDNELSEQSTLSEPSVEEPPTPARGDGVKRFDLAATRSSSWRMAVAKAMAQPDDAATADVGSRHVSCP